MRRLTITLEDYDNSKVVRSILLEHDGDLRTASSLLDRTGVPFSIEEVGEELFDYVLDDGGRHVDLPLRTKEEIRHWIRHEPFEICVEGFIESASAKIHLSLNNSEASLTVARRHSVRNS